MNETQLSMLKTDIDLWNRWRAENVRVIPDLETADLAELDLRRADLSGCNLRKALLSDADLGVYVVSDGPNVHVNLQNADLSGAEFHDACFLGADLRGADLQGARGIGANFRYANLTNARCGGALLRGASFSEATLGHVDMNMADLWGATFSKASLTDTILSRANLRETNFSRARLTACQVVDANLAGATLVETVLERTNLSGSTVYGVSAWNLKLDHVTQRDLLITPNGEPSVTVDELEVAQFVYLIINNLKLRQVIDTLTSKVVLILGRFSEDRKAVLEAIRTELRHLGFVPLLFDFDKPTSKDLTGTVETLARIAKFIIADLTDPSSIPHEMATIVPFLRSTPVLPLRRRGTGGYSMFDDLQRYPWVRPVQEYADVHCLVSSLREIIGSVDTMAAELR